MCGIAGWFSPQPTPAAAAHAALARGLRAIGHRGPDGSGTLVDGHAAFAHARLAVIDPVGGVQPMWSADGRAALVFNGEIYNYRELRARLAARGVVFRTHSDAEVVLASWLDGGAAALAALRGMYAFALWNRAERTGVLVRDPLGIKPLFVATDAAGGLRFASEAKGILALDGARPRLDENALHLLLNLRYVPGQASLFRGIRQLAPGEVLVWRPDGSTRSAIPEAPVADYPDLRSAIADSVAAHLTADVEVGCYLSGGIDSATIAALAAQRLDSGPRTFTLPVGDDPAEADGAAATAAALGLAHHPGPEPVADRDTLDRVLFALEAPKVNALQSFALASHARPRVKVALSGLGGDELFLGYNVHRIAWRLAQLDRRMPRALTRALGAASAGALRALSRTPYTEPGRAAGLLANLGDWPLVYGLLRNVWDSAALRRRFYGPRLLDAAPDDAFAWLRAAWPTGADPLSALAGFEWSHKMVNDLLWHEDRVSMASGVEVRVPFVDTRLLGYVRAHEARLPVEQRLGKRTLRAAVRGLVPDAVLARPKSGFQLDAPAFVGGPLKPYVDEWLADDRVRALGLFDPGGVRALRALPARRAHRWHYFLLYLMAQAHHWVDAFEHGRLLDPLLRDVPDAARVGDGTRG